MNNLRKYYVFFILIFFILGVSETLFAENIKKIDINKASITELATLQRIGSKTAANIIDYRTKNGSFKRIEDLLNVKGIGPKIFALNKDKIIVGSASEIDKSKVDSTIKSKIEPKIEAGKTNLDKKLKEPIEKADKIDDKTPLKLKLDKK